MQIRTMRWTQRSAMTVGTPSVLRNIFGKRWRYWALDSKRQVCRRFLFGGGDLHGRELSERPDGPFSEAEGASSPIDAMCMAFLVPAGRVPRRETARPPALGTIRLARFQAAHYNSDRVLRLNGPVFRRWTCRSGGEEGTSKRFERRNVCIPESVDLTTRTRNRLASVRDSYYGT